MNLQMGFPGPKINETIHDHKKGKIVHKYKKIHDGLHPDTYTRNEWARVFATNAITGYKIIHSIPL